MNAPDPSEQIRFCTSRDNARIAFASAGAGSPLVWLGHWSRHLRFDWQSPVWRPWLRLLTRRHRVIRYDWRGCGLSDREGVEHTYDKHLEDLEAVVDAAGLNEFVLFGQAGACSTCLTYAARNPARVSRLVLYGCQTRGRMVRDDPKFRSEGEALLKMIELGWDNRTPAFAKFTTMLHMPDAKAGQLKAYDDLLHLATTPANAIALLRVFFNADAGDDAQRVRCPTLVIHAREDAIVPFEEGRRAAALIPNARFAPIESRNHILQEDEPAWQQLARELENFLPVAPAGAGASRLQLLTAQENRVLGLLARGMDNGEIAGTLKISEKTVRNHVSNVLGKLEVGSRAKAVALARDSGIGQRMEWPPGIAG